MGLMLDSLDSDNRQCTIQVNLNSTNMTLIKDGNKSLFEIRNKRQTAILRIEVWRTLEASRRKGNIN